MKSDGHCCNLSNDHNNKIRPPTPHLTTTIDQSLRNDKAYCRRMGVEREVLRQGDQTTYPEKGQKLAMHYKGTLKKDGTKFDSSYDRAVPFTFKIGKGEVIQGWDEGVMKMSLGEKAKLTISSDYGYGKEGAGGVIPPDADLVFVVELLKIGTAEVKKTPANSCCVVM